MTNWDNIKEKLISLEDLMFDTKQHEKALIDNAKTEVKLCKQIEKELKIRNKEQASELETLLLLFCLTELKIEPLLKKLKKIKDKPKKKRENTAVADGERDTIVGGTVEAIHRGTIVIDDSNGINVYSAPITTIAGASDGVSGSGQAGTSAARSIYTTWETITPVRQPRIEDWYIGNGRAQEPPRRSLRERLQSFITPSETTAENDTTRLNHNEFNQIRNDSPTDGTI